MRGDEGRDATETVNSKRPTNRCSRYSDCISYITEYPLQSSTAILSKCRGQMEESWTARLPTRALALPFTYTVYDAGTRWRDADWLRPYGDVPASCFSTKSYRSHGVWGWVVLHTFSGFPRLLLQMGAASSGHPGLFSTPVQHVLAVAWLMGGVP